MSLKKHIVSLLSQVGDSVSKETLDETSSLQKITYKKSQTAQEANQKKNEYFLKQTDKVF